MRNKCTALRPEIHIVVVEEATAVSASTSVAAMNNEHANAAPSHKHTIHKHTQTQKTMKSAEEKTDSNKYIVVVI